MTIITISDTRERLTAWMIALMTWRSPPTDFEPRFPWLRILHVFLVQLVEDHQHQIIFQQGQMKGHGITTIQLMTPSRGKLEKSFSLRHLQTVDWLVSKKKVLWRNFVLSLTKPRWWSTWMMKLSSNFYVLSLCYKV